MKIDLKKQTVLITGASSGFGMETARLLSKSGYKLILVARREDRLKKLASELRTEIHFQKLDITYKEDVLSFIENLPKEFKEIDVLVNNAGLAIGLDTSDIAEISDWEKMVDTNVKGLLYMTRAVLPGMKKRNSGHIVNIGSVAAIAPYKGGNVYGATKAFVKQFSKNLRTDLFGSSIKVTNIEPGMAETEFSNVRFKGDTLKAKSVYESTKPLSAEDIAETIKWVISRPDHVNIDNVEIMPLCQTWGGMVTNRKI